MKLPVSPQAQRLYEHLPPVSWKTEKNLAKEIGVRAATVKQLKEELEAARLIDIYLHRNGKRINPKHEIKKNSPKARSPILKHITGAYALSAWSYLDRDSLVECYLKSDWNVVPFQEKGKQPVKGFNTTDWEKRSATERMDFFFKNQALNIGLVVSSEMMVVDVDSKENEWLEHESFENTLTVSTARGFQHYFQSDAVVSMTTAKILPDIDTRCAGSYVVLPPSIHATGVTYEWINLAYPEPLPIEFRRDWRQSYFESTRKNNGQFVLPETIGQGDRNDTLWRYGRSLRNQDKNYHEIKLAMTEANKTRCQPPLLSGELNMLIRNVWNRSDRT